MRLTKIICTLGPSSNSRDMIRSLAKSGMNIARLNFSHGDQETHRKTIRLIQEINKEDGSSIATLLDTMGSEIRTGERKEPLEITTGMEVVFSRKELPKEKRPVIQVNYDG